MMTAPVRAIAALMMAMMFAAMMARVNVMMTVRVTRCTVMTIGLC